MTVTLSRLENEYRLEAQTSIARPLEEVFEFFASIHNLERITPNFLNFRVLSAANTVIEESTILHYRLKLYGVAIHWTTLISEWEPLCAFTDEQLSGPYRYWIHRHEFTRVDEHTTSMRDFVRYQPFGGQCTHALFVGKMLKQIFEYREETIGRLLSD